MSSLGKPLKSGTSPQLTIAHIMPWSGIGGVEIATCRIVDATRDRFRHIALCIAGESMQQAAFAELGVETVWYEPPQSSLRHFSRFYRASQGVAEKLRAAEVDIAHFADLKAAMHCGMAAGLAGVKRISHVRNVFPEGSVRGMLELLFVQNYIFVSKQARDFSAVPTFQAASDVLYDAVEVPPLIDAQIGTEVRREFDIPLDAPVVGMVARVNPQKDYVTLAHAAALVLKQYPATRFLIVGDNGLVDTNREHYAEIAVLLRTLGIANSFVFTGHRPDVNRLIQAMDFCVLSTHREGFPLSILETMAMGKAVVATDVGGIPEIIEPGKNGYLTPHGESEALAGYLLQMIKNPDQAHAMGSYALDHVRRNYSKQGFVEGLSRIYRRVAKDRGA